MNIIPDSSRVENAARARNIVNAKTKGILKMPTLIQITRRKLKELFPKETVSLICTFYEFPDGTSKVDWSVVSSKKYIAGPFKTFSELEAHVNALYAKGWEVVQDAERILEKEEKSGND